MRYLKTYNESKKNKPNIKKYLIGDFVVLQGKDSSSNDMVTFEMSSEDDIWMHTKGVPGSHVLIKVKEQLPTEDVIKQAAEIAAKNSKSKEDNVVVVYCKKKFVKKESGMSPGQVKVDYKNSYQIVVSK